MTDSENFITQTPDAGDTSNPPIKDENNFNIDFGGTVNEEQGDTTNFKEIFSENVNENSQPSNLFKTSENDQIEPQISQSTIGIGDEQITNSLDTSNKLGNEESGNTLINNTSPQVDTDSSSPIQESVENNGVFLGNFGSGTIATIENNDTITNNDTVTNYGTSVNNDTITSNEFMVINQPNILNEPQNLGESTISDTNIQSQEKAKLSQKEKLAQLIKIHESKAQKNGFTKGLLAGILLITGILLISFTFAKNQILDLLGEGDSNNSSLNASIVTINNGNIVSDNSDLLNNNENSEAINEADIVVEDMDGDNADVDSNYENNVDGENIDENSFISDIFEELDNNENANEENLGDNSENIAPNNGINPDLENSETGNNGYSIIHVDSEEDANWVLPSYCTDLTCYGENEEFTPCSTFKLSENIGENIKRIGNNGKCIYKDPSELVYVEFNQ